MALQKVFIGSVGPFLYEDTDPINDVDGDFAGEDRCALVTSGQLFVEGAPTNPNNIVRLQDLAGVLTPTFADITAGRALNTVYQNGDYLTFAQISLRLSENPSPTTLAPTTVLTTSAPPTLAPTTAPLEGARANFLEEAVDPPTIITGIVAKALGGNEYVELTLSVIIPPNHYFMLEEDQPYVEILRWIEYQLGV
jgi:hypothetical protein